MDPAIVPLILVALGAGIYSTWVELRSSLEPAVCTECPHCRDAIAQRQAVAREQARRQVEVRTLYTRQKSLEDRDKHDRR